MIRLSLESSSNRYFQMLKLHKRSVSQNSNHGSAFAEDGGAMKCAVISWLMIDAVYPFLLEMLLNQGFGRLHSQAVAAARTKGGSLAAGGATAWQASRQSSTNRTHHQPTAQTLHSQPKQNCDSRRQFFSRYFSWHQTQSQTASAPLKRALTRWNTFSVRRSSPASP